MLGTLGCINYPIYNASLCAGHAYITPADLDDWGFEHHSVHLPGACYYIFYNVSLSESLVLHLCLVVPGNRQDILAEGEISSAQQRAASEGLGLLARLGSDIFTAKMVSQWFDL